MAAFFSSHHRRIFAGEESATHGLDDNEYGGDLEAQIAGNCFNSRPFLFLDMLWNLAFILVSVLVLLATFHEQPSTPLRLWICVYALQCLLHVGFVWNEYLKRNHGFDSSGVQEFYVLWVFPFSSFCYSSIIKKLEMMNTVVSSIWWVFGFYWIVIGGPSLLQDSPRLYWLSVIFLAFDVFFMIFSIAMASFLFLLLFCCFPMLVYAMKIDGRASENEIASLPRFCFRQQQQQACCSDAAKREHDHLVLLQPEDSECCICLYKYVDGAEVCMLPCNHHFHGECISRWLRINSTCPLCKFDIRKGDKLV
ncbi:hypothetical protein M569_05133 [Genlisea aurea]|uniref:RING-type E3 ubiquitin transferase n=1 Tax=Genlisea aurea TaxID=192259 RepID=S8CQZ1_9LAMI|nr:hypothetical protein M569_05133 [Genlisea aurea]